MTASEKLLGISQRTASDSQERLAFLKWKGVA